MRGDRAAGKFALLMHADRAVKPVVDDDHDDVGAVLHGGREFLAVHQEIAVAGEANDDAVGEKLLGGNRGGNAEAHRPRGRPELLFDGAEAQEATDPDREIAGAGGEDRVGNAPAQREHDLADLHLPGVAGACSLHARYSARASRVASDQVMAFGG